MERRHGGGRRDGKNLGTRKKNATCKGGGIRGVKAGMGGEKQFLGGGSRK